VNYDLRAKFLRKFLPSLVEGSRAAWCGGASGDEGTTLGARAQLAIQRAAVLYKPRLATFIYLISISYHYPPLLLTRDQYRSLWYLHSGVEFHYDFPLDNPWIEACWKLISNGMIFIQAASLVYGK
jgi:hypothetical protein